MPGPQSAAPTRPAEPELTDSDLKPAAKPTETLSEIIKSLEPLAPGILDAVKTSARHTTIQLAIVVAGGCAVLGLAYFAAMQREWGVVEKLAIPVLAFLGGMLAGKKS